MKVRVMEVLFPSCSYPVHTQNVLYRLLSNGTKTTYKYVGVLMAQCHGTTVLSIKYVVHQTVRQPPNSIKFYLLKSLTHGNQVFNIKNFVDKISFAIFKDTHRIAR